MTVFQVCGFDQVVERKRGREENGEQDQVEERTRGLLAFLEGYGRVIELRLSASRIGFEKRV